MAWSKVKHDRSYADALTSNASQDKKGGDPRPNPTGQEGMRQALYEQIMQVRSRNRHGRSRGKANRKQQSQVKWERGQACLLADVLPADPVPSPTSVLIPPKPRRVSEGCMRALAAITGREIASEVAGMAPVSRHLYGIPEGAAIGQGQRTH